MRVSCCRPIWHSRNENQPKNVSVLMMWWIPKRSSNKSSSKYLIAAGDRRRNNTFSQKLKLEFKKMNTLKKIKGNFIQIRKKEDSGLAETNKNRLETESSYKHQASRISEIRKNPFLGACHRATTQSAEHE